MSKDEKCPDCGLEYNPERPEVDRAAHEEEPRVACLVRQLAQAKEEKERLWNIIAGAMPALEEAASDNPECLGMVAPPLDDGGTPVSPPWSVIDEMIARFREATEEATK